MRALVQRVSEASITVEGNLVSRIGPGILVLIGIRHSDTRTEAEYLAKKIVRLRIFPDSQGKMNRSLLDVSGELLIVSQFTLYGETRKGNRPSYSEAARPEMAEALYHHFVEQCKREGVPVATGVFQAQMDVFSINRGPVTLICQSET
jgi:D-aminoacyl-tRNA deacylase